MLLLSREGGLFGGLFKEETKINAKPEQFAFGSRGTPLSSHARPKPVSLRSWPRQVVDLDHLQFAGEVGDVGIQKESPLVAFADGYPVWRSSMPRVEMWAVQLCQAASQVKEQ